MGKFTLREHLAGLRNNDQLLLMLVMSFLLINVFNIRGGGYMYFITYALQGSTGYTSLFFTMVTFASIIGSEMCIRDRLGDCQPINAAFRYRQNLLLHQPAPRCAGGVDVVPAFWPGLSNAVAGGDPR